MAGLIDWIVSYFQPQANAGNWLAAAFGAFVIRFAYPKLPIKASIAGWLCGIIIACLFAQSVVKSHRFDLLEPYAIWALVALLGDVLIQITAWTMRIISGIGTYTEQHPGEAFDQGLERVEKVTNVWLRIKAPLLDLLNEASKLFSKKP